MPVTAIRFRYASFPAGFWVYRSGSNLTWSCSVFGQVFFKTVTRENLACHSVDWGGLWGGVQPGYKTFIEEHPGKGFEYFVEGNYRGGSNDGIVVRWYDPYGCQVPITPNTPLAPTTQTRNYSSNGWQDAIPLLYDVEVRQNIPLIPFTIRDNGILIYNINSFSDRATYYNKCPTVEILSQSGCPPGTACECNCGGNVTCCWDANGVVIGSYSN